MEKKCLDLMEAYMRNTDFEVDHTNNGNLKKIFEHAKQQSLITQKEMKSLKKIIS